MLQHTLKGHNDRIWQVAWHPNGQILASCSSDKTVKLWSLIEGKYQLIQTLDDCHTKTVRSVSFSHNGQFLATGGFDSLVGVWMIDQGKYKLIQKLEGHDSEVKCVAWSGDSKYLASCSKDKTVWIWDHDDLEFCCNCILQAHDQDVKYVRWHNNTLYSGSYDNTVIQYTYGEDEEWENNTIFNDHGSTVWCIDVFNDLILTTSADCTAKIYKNHKLIQNLQGNHNEPIYSGTFSHDGHFVALGSGDNKISIYKLAKEMGMPNYELHQIFEAFEYDVNSVQFNPKSNLLAVCGDDQVIKLYEL